MKKVALILCNDMHMDIDNANILLNHIMQNKAYEVVCDYTIADIVIINTCAFGANKMYSVRVIADVCINSKPNAEIIVTGCLTRLNANELKAISGITVKTFEEVCRYFGVLKRGLQQIVPQNKVIISEGCLHKCSYCVYPLIANKYRSKPIETILEEIRNLDKVESTIYITGAQETSDYGIDIYGKRSFDILIKRILSEFPDNNYVIGWFHPSGLTDKVIEEISNNPNIVEIMLHLQHVDEKVLKAMNRPAIEDFDSKICKLKHSRPELIISTEVIVGFPGETEVEFQKLIQYLEKGYFDDIGVASYESVVGTKAASLPNQVSVEQKAKRLDLIKKIFSATCYPADENSSEPIIVEYMKTYNSLIYRPQNILTVRQRQKYNCIAGVDTSSKLEEFEQHLSDVFECVKNARTEYDFQKSMQYIHEKYTLDARKLFFAVINNVKFKNALKERASKLLLEE